jgi:hypothetical protein
VGPAEGGVTDLGSGVGQVRRDDDWSVEERLLALSLTHPMRTPVLLGVPGIPLETGAVREDFGEFWHS